MPRNGGYRFSAWNSEEVQKCHSKQENLQTVVSICIPSPGLPAIGRQLAFDNPLTLTFDLLTSGQCMRSAQLPYVYRLWCWTAGAVFLLKCGETDRQTYKHSHRRNWSPYPRLDYRHTSINQSIKIYFLSNNNNKYYNTARERSKVWDAVLLIKLMGRRLYSWLPLYIGIRCPNLVLTCVKYNLLCLARPTCSFISTNKAIKCKIVLEYRCQYDTTLLNFKIFCTCFSLTLFSHHRCEPSRLSKRPKRNGTSSCGQKPFARNQRLYTVKISLYLRILCGEFSIF